MSSRIPAVVREVDRARREIRVEIPGYTDGAAQFPLAEIEYPIGDRSAQTEIRILPGDDVWVAFINGDARYPIITGFRTKHTGNDVGTRRWFHDNFETIADDEHRIAAGSKLTLDVGGTLVTITPGKVQIDSTDVVVNGKTVFNGTVTINGDTSVSGALSATDEISSQAKVSAPEATINGISFTTHRHGGVQGGGGTSGGPV